jgi:hypothetical protein
MAMDPMRAGFGAPHPVHPQKEIYWRCWDAPWQPLLRWERPLRIFEEEGDEIGG